MNTKLIKEHLNAISELLENSAPKWELGRILPGFRALRDGEEWHRQDWTEDMLPPGYRPLLLGERLQAGDEEFWRGEGPEWHRCDGHMPDADAEHVPFRTRRPLPEPEKHVPLGPSDWMKDGPWWIAPKKSQEFAHLITSVTPDGVDYDAGSMTHERAAEYVRTNDGINWSKCHKPA